MKKSALTPCLAFVLMLILSWSAYTQPDNKHPQLVLQKREFDFGNIKEGTRISHAFTILNQGEAVLEIREVSPG